MVFVALRGYLTVRFLSGLSGVSLRMVMMRVPVRQRLAGYSEGGDHHKHRREKAVERTAVHTPKLGSARQIRYYRAETWSNVQRRSGFTSHVQDRDMHGGMLARPRRVAWSIGATDSHQRVSRRLPSGPSRALPKRPL